MNGQQDLQTVLAQLNDRSSSPAVGANGKAWWPKTHQSDTCEDFKFRLDNWEQVGDAAARVLSRLKVQRS